MKKIILTLAAASLILSCKKIPKGGNHGVLKLEEGVERYDTHDRRYEGEGGSTHGEATTSEHGNHATDKVELDVNGIKLHGFKGGLEESLVSFLKSDGYNKATDDNALKSKWYSFDNVNFKMNSSTELLDGSMEQLDNLAKILKAYPDAKIKIGGYTDKTGDEAVNKRISTARANFIKQELTKMGVGNQVISAEGYGSEFATVAADASNEERAADRKMAVRFTK